MWPSVWSFSRPVLQPDDVRDAERIDQQAIELRASHPGIAVRLEEARLGREQRAFAVDVDRAAFEHLAPHERGHVERARELLADAIVTRHHVLAAPSVEAEAHARARALRVADDDRRGVARPAVAVLHAMEADARNAREERARARFDVRVAHEQLDVLVAVLGDRATETRVLDLRVLEQAAPLLGEVGEREPDRAMARPFGGHREAAITGGGGRHGARA